jgi:ubiquinone/menaquinone biosynthesis C-methylase UbiE
MERDSEGMRDYWNERARENAAWYVDTTCDYDNPDMEAFLSTGPKVVATALTEAPIQPPERDLAVEIGPGLGRICLALADHFDRVVGVDISEEMVERARKMVDNPRITFEVGNGTDLQPLRDQSADFVLTFTVLQHLTKASLIEGYLREAARVLKPGGVLAAQWNNTPRPRVWKLRVAWWKVRTRVGGPLRIDIRNSPEFAGTRLPYSRVQRVLAEAGMTVRASTGRGTLFAWVWAEKRADSGAAPASSSR